MQQPENEKPYTIEDLLRDYGGVGEGGDDDNQPTIDGADEPEEQYLIAVYAAEDDEDEWPVAGSLTPKPHASRQMRERLHRAHIRLAHHAGRLADRCGPSAHKRIACLARLAQYNDELRHISTYLFEGQNGNQAIRGEIGAALRDQRHEIHIQQSQLAGEYGPLGNDMDGTITGYSHAVAIRATAETMRELRYEGQHQTGAARASTHAAIVELYYHAQLNHDCIRHEAHCSIQYSWDTPTADALKECGELYEETLRDFNRSLMTTSYSRSMKGSGTKLDPEIGRSLLEPEGIVAGIATRAGPRIAFLPCPRRKDSVPYLVFSHQGARHIQAVDDPFPQDVPASAALQMLRTCRDLIAAMDRMDENTLRQAISKAERAVKDAEAGVGNVSPFDRRAFARWTKSIGMTPGATADLIEAALEDPDAADRFLDDAGVNGRQVGKRVARSIIKHARRNGLDENQLERLADSMGWYEAEELGVKPYRPTPDQAALTARIAHDLGFHAETAVRIRRIMETWARRAKQPSRPAWIGGR